MGLVVEDLLIGRNLLAPFPVNTFLLKVVRLWLAYNNGDLLKGSI